jgi:signal transduction histidine kinase
MMTLAAISDISVRKRLELELRQANANLEEFTYVASHDLRSPLRGIADLVEWITEDLGDADLPKVRHNLERVTPPHPAHGPADGRPAELRARRIGPPTNSRRSMSTRWCAASSTCSPCGRAWC